jgi:hypothetical protein
MAAAVAAAIEQGFDTTPPDVVTRYPEHGVTMEAIDEGTLSINPPPDGIAPTVSTVSWR